MASPSQLGLFILFLCQSNVRGKPLQETSATDSQGFETICSKPPELPSFKKVNGYDACTTELSYGSLEIVGTSYPAGTTTITSEGLVQTFGTKPYWSRSNVFGSGKLWSMVGSVESDLIVGNEEVIFLDIGGGVDEEHIGLADRWAHVLYGGSPVSMGRYLVQKLYQYGNRIRSCGTVQHMNNEEWGFASTGMLGVTCMFATPLVGSSVPDIEFVWASPTLMFGVTDPATMGHRQCVVCLEGPPRSAAQPRITHLPVTFGHFAQGYYVITDERNRILFGLGGNGELVDTPWGTSITRVSTEEVQDFQVRTWAGGAAQEPIDWSKKVHRERSIFMNIDPDLKLAVAGREFVTGSYMPTTRRICAPPYYHLPSSTETSTIQPSYGLRYEYPSQRKSNCNGVGFCFIFCSVPSCETDQLKEGLVDVQDAVSQLTGEVNDGFALVTESINGIILHANYLAEALVQSNIFQNLNFDSILKLHTELAAIVTDQNRVVNDINTNLRELYGFNVQMRAEKDYARRWLEHLGMQPPEICSDPLLECYRNELCWVWRPVDGIEPPENFTGYPPPTFVRPPLLSTISPPTVATPGFDELDDYWGKTGTTVSYVMIGVLLILVLSLAGVVYWIWTRRTV